MTDSEIEAIEIGRAALNGAMFSVRNLPDSWIRRDPRGGNWGFVLFGSLACESEKCFETKESALLGLKSWLRANALESRLLVSAK
jgi:hypothetical protein